MAFTFFFRDIQILELAIKHVVPFAIGRSRINVWDAGCVLFFRNITSYPLSQLEVISVK